MRFEICLLASLAFASSFVGDPVSIADSDLEAIDEAVPKEGVTVHFIRHAESGWNIYQAEHGLFKQLFAQLDSSLKDARLTKRGVDQTMMLASFIQQGGCSKADRTQAWAESCLDRIPLKEDISSKAIPDDEPGKSHAAGITPSCSCGEADFLNSDAPAVIATSNLSRAILTGLIALKSRITKSSTPVLMMSLLQELGAGIDAKTDTPAHTFPDLRLGMYIIQEKRRKERGHGMLAPKSDISPRSRYFRSNEEYFETVKARFDLNYSVGDFNSGILGPNAATRFQNFCFWALHVSDKDIIVAGHSGWLLKFLQSHLPLEGRNEVEDTVTHHKLGNGSLITFKIVPDEKRVCRIVSGETQFVYGTIHYAQ